MPRPTKRKLLPAKNGELDSKWEAALSALYAGKTPCQAMVHAGFAHTYAATGGAQKLKRLVLSRAQELLDSYRGGSLLALDKIGEAERQLAEHLANGNFQELPKFAANLKQIKQSAGALAQEVEGTRPVLVQVALNIQQHFSKGLEDDTVTVQVSEPKKGGS